jgi:hypothetical protein
VSNTTSAAGQIAGWVWDGSVVDVAVVGGAVVGGAVGGAVVGGAVVCGAVGGAVVGAVVATAVVGATVVVAAGLTVVPLLDISSPQAAISTSEAIMTSVGRVRSTAASFLRGAIPSRGRDTLNLGRRSRSSISTMLVFRSRAKPRRLEHRRCAR